jgi:hypothetical protein
VCGLLDKNYAIRAKWQDVRLTVGKGLAAPTQINVVLNWFEELKKKVPVK